MLSFIFRANTGKYWKSSKGFDKGYETFELNSRLRWSKFRDVQGDCHGAGCFAKVGAGLASGFSYFSPISVLILLWIIFSLFRLKSDE